jgi:hypothetical protein
VTVEAGYLPAKPKLGLAASARSGLSQKRANKLTVLLQQLLPLIPIELTKENRWRESQVAADNGRPIPISTLKSRLPYE